jgi:tetratricopeptide (TPR) repeat protein
MKVLGAAALAALMAGPLLAASADAGPAALFREGNELFRAGDYPKAIEAYGEVARSGAESASLYWNWAQAALARGRAGEALWALLRGREVEPGDRALAREIERLREAGNLDPAEIAPVPLAGVRRASRRFHLDLLALVLLVGSVVLHALARRALGPGRLATAADLTLGLGLLLACAPLAGAFARPTAVVVQSGASLTDAASPTAAALGTLREGEVVTVLAESEGYVRIEDSSGARGWASTDAARLLDRPR